MEVFGIVIIILVVLILLAVLSKTGPPRFGQLTHHQSQLQHISHVGFEPQQLFNKSEYSVFRILEKTGITSNST